MTIQDTNQEVTTPTEAEQADALTERMFQATIGTLELFSVYLGTELGLYSTLHKAGGLTEGELAERAGIAPRYAREWLEQQSVAGFISVDEAALEPECRRYCLPAAHGGPLVDRVDGGHVAPFAGMVVGVAAALDLVADAYRSGAGVTYENYGTAFRHGQGGINRPAFTEDLVQSWLPSTAGLLSKLDAGARVLDVGSGHGWSTISVAKSWPQAEVIGIDLDRASVEDARVNARSCGIDVSFAVSGVAAAQKLGPFDAALILEALHDMAQPVEVLTDLRRAMTNDGIVVIADEAVAESFTAPGDELERMMYGWSVSHCLPVGMAEKESCPTGTALRPSDVKGMAVAAGFGSFEVVDVDGGFFRIYRLGVS